MTRWTDAGAHLQARRAPRSTNHVADRDSAAQLPQLTYWNVIEIASVKLDVETTTMSRYQHWKL